MVLQVRVISSMRSIIPQRKGRLGIMPSYQAQPVARNSGRSCFASKSASLPLRFSQNVRYILILLRLSSAQVDLLDDISSSKSRRSRSTTSAKNTSYHRRLVLCRGNAISVPSFAPRVSRYPSQNASLAFTKKVSSRGSPQRACPTAGRIAKALNSPSSVKATNTSFGEPVNHTNEGTSTSEKRNAEMARPRALRSAVIGRSAEAETASMSDSRSAVKVSCQSYDGLAGAVAVGRPNQSFWAPLCRSPRYFPSWRSIRVSCSAVIRPDARAR